MAIIDKPWVDKIRKALEVKILQELNNPCPADCYLCDGEGFIHEYTSKHSAGVRTWGICRGGDGCTNRRPCPVVHAFGAMS